MKYLQRLVFSLFTFFLFSPALFSQTAESAAEHAQRRAPTFWDFLVHPRFAFKFSVMLVLGIVVLVLLKTKKDCSHRCEQSLYESDTFPFMQLPPFPFAG